MKRILSIKYLFYLFFLLFLPLVSRVHAAANGDFIVDYDVQYVISDQGQTNVTQTISLVNKQTNLYAREYSILIDSSKIRDVQASDRKGPIIPQVKLKDGKTEIRLVFNDQIVGQGQILRFSLRYIDDNITRKNGMIWEINIPGIAEDQDLGNYIVRLSVPPTFGPPAYLVPQPKDLYIWGKDQLINGGISAAFGIKQTFELTLHYYLENTKTTGIETEIALPPSTSFQKMILESIDPKPSVITTDADGNWLARYKLAPGSQVSIEADLLAELYLHPRASYQLNMSDEATYTKPTQYWQTKDPEVIAIAKKLGTPRAIYDYVVKTLMYDYNRVNNTGSRKGAIDALKNPNTAVCTEFTDVFVALARAAGIPAREAVGFAYTTNPKLRPLSLVSDVLHAWPEYYDATKNIWVPVDPTWGNTTGGVNYFDKLDFNHIVFAYNGADDTYPLPAGFYRQAGKTGRDVEVRFKSESPQAVDPTVTMNFLVPKQVIAGVAANGFTIIKNASQVAAENATITLESEDFSLHKTLTGQVIPPYGQITIPFELKTKTPFSRGNGVITASVNGVSQNQYIAITPISFVALPAIVLVVWLVITAILLILRARKWKRLKKK